MARYVDLEELAKRIAKNVKPESIEEKELVEWCKDECIRQGYAMPTANVAPRADVAREIFEEIEGLVMEDILADLKKKYESEGADDV